MVLEDSGEQRSPKGTYAGWRRWRRLWRGWIVIPTGIGVSVFTVLQWRRISWNNEPTHQNGSFQITCYRAVPLRAMSRAWGWISSQHVPLSLRCWLYTRYANIYGVNIDEAAHSLEHYSSLCEFFIRPLKEGSRPVAEFDSIVSPADGSVINAGVVNSCNVEQIKGVTYTIKTFLGEPTWNGNAALEAADDDYPKLVSNGSPSNNGILPKSTSMTASRHDKSSVSRSTSYFKYSNADNMLQNLEHDGCELLHLDFDNSYRCASKMDVYDSRRLGWLVLYFQFCIKDLLVNSFHIGFQIMYGIKSSITLSNGRILKGASFLRSHFSFSSYSSSSSSSSSSAFENEMKGEPTIERLSAASDSDSDDDSGSGASVDDSSSQWQAYKGKLLHNPDNELYQFVVYLAPGDYHRFHSPADLKINFRRHFQGELLSVHPKITKWIPELFSLNERAVYVGEWEHGFFSLVAVGATNVGSIKVHSDRELLTNTRRWKHGPHFKDKHLDVEWKKGEEIGEFRMGSTIVLLFEAPKNFSFCTQSGEKIKVGESVTNWRGGSSGASTSD